MLRFFIKCLDKADDLLEEVYWWTHEEIRFVRNHLDDIDRRQKEK